MLCMILHTPCLHTQQSLPDMLGCPPQTTPPTYMVSSTPCDAFIACLCLVSFKGTDETPWLGSKPVCLARASQRLLALWHVFNHAFAGQQVTFVNLQPAD